MKDICPGPELPRTLNLSYQVGVFLAVNAVSDACVLVDGLDCVMTRTEYIFGNHDLGSTLLSPSGGHRVLYTMQGPLPQKRDPDRFLLSALKEVSASGRFSAALVTGLPFLKLSGADYAGAAAAAGGDIPVADVPPASLEADWLDGYGLSLEALVRALPVSRRKRTSRRKVALIGYPADRGEGDHAGNLRELRGLLRACGLDPVCVFPSGGPFKGLRRALEAGVVVSLPYGRRAARALAARTGAVLAETELPVGLKGTWDWLEAVRRAAGLRGPLPAAVNEARLAAARRIAPVTEELRHRNAVWVGDPYLFRAFRGLAAELGLRVPLALVSSFHRPTGRRALPGRMLFSPDMREALAAVKALAGYDAPELFVGNSFARSEGLCGGAPLVELGFPSYGHHCLAEEPFMGFAGAAVLAGRLFNALRGGWCRSGCRGTPVPRLRD